MAPLSRSSCEIPLHCLFRLGEDTRWELRGALLLLFGCLCSPADILADNEDKVSKGGQPMSAPNIAALYCAAPLSYGLTHEEDAGWDHEYTHGVDMHVNSATFTFSSALRKAGDQQ